MRIRLSAALLLALTMLVAACGGGDDTNKTASVTPAASGAAPATPTPTPAVTGNVTVFAAASLTDAFNQLGAEFSKVNPRATVKFSFAASSALRTQLEQGARADVFASADQANMDAAKKSGAIGGEDLIFAKNRLVMIYPTRNPAGITTLQDLAKPGVKFVLTDSSVPIGAYARQSLDKMSGDPAFGADFTKRVLANLRSEEANVRAVVTKVQLGEADAAIVYATDVTPAVSKEITSVAIPDSFNTLATYPLAVVKDTPNAAAARAFIAYVRSAAGQAILKKWNFITDKDTGAAQTSPIRGPGLFAASMVSVGPVQPSRRSRFAA